MDHQPTEAARPPVVPWVPSLANVARLLHEDWVTHDRAWARRGLHAVAVHRLGSWHRTLRGPVRHLTRLIYGLLYFVVRNLYGIELPAEAHIGRRLRIAHGVGLVVNGGSRIGDDCLLRHGITLGAPSRELAHLGPTLCDKVEVGPGAVILGSVTIGESARIGPNALVIEDVPAGGRATAPLARISPPKGRDAASASVEGDAPAHPSDRVAGTGERPR